MNNIFDNGLPFITNMFLTASVVILATLKVYEYLRERKARKERERVSALNKKYGNKYITFK
ncbi:hypothetical protein [Brochothrix phage ADU4]|nr:hypothetical protein [Brochothrix phage ADU4]